MIAAAGLLVSRGAEASPALYWPDDTADYSSTEPTPPPAPAPKRRHKAQRRPDVKPDKLGSEARKPQGPLVIAISIDKQQLKLYDANGLFAETPVSTGMRGHSTPMGVFSVIQKHKWHRSNIYSGAPMPYMQRITWSGVAMHAGVLPGYPASHGCIRMPTNFATRMWGWTRMGARVVITPGEIAPEHFAHPLLIAQKPAPVPGAALPEPVTTGKSDKAAAAPVVPELRSTLASDKPAIAAPAIASSAPAQRRTADASSVLPGPAASDAIPNGKDAANEAAAPVAPAASEATTPPAAEPSAAKAVETTESVAPPAAAPELPKDQGRAADAGAAKPDQAQPAKRGGPISVLVSRKDGKLYVRQNFAPLFDAPIEIAGDRPLGTHVFTAKTDKADKADASAITWSVLSMPNAPRRAEMADDDGPARRRKSVGAIEVKSVPLPGSAAEALDRLKIPPDAVARIAEQLSTGSSIIVSDQGIAAGETGEGTDFIVRLR
ncbi:MAG TPA: L,D-transpeptidase [Rhodopseudomonas sp.]|uniref:L,D-transpeptidase n=1 Tax=Rhodopseudomonas sp. TaxID=1078 RepID=UPI002ED8E597